MIGVILTSMIEIKLTPVELTPDEAELFKKFMEHHDLFLLLLKRGVFDQKNASVVLNFDHQGILQNIQRQDFLFSRKHDLH